jgi:parallel beta-helix repeat protein
MFAPLCSVKVRKKESGRMKWKTALWIMLTLLLIGGSMSASLFLPLKATPGTIYIRSDGSVEGTDKIQRDGDVYTFTDDISDEIVIERSNIVIDGAAHTLQESERTGSGFFGAGITNVTIKNTNIQGFYVGINFTSVSNNTIFGNNIINNTRGILLSWLSNNNSIYANNIIGNGYGVWLLGDSASNNSIYGNNVTVNDIGVYLEYATGNRIYHNNFADNIEADAYVAISGYSNTWDDGYPSGGNYWSDYTGADYYSGSDQDQPGCDGIVDKAYVIDENNVDRYPLMSRKQYDWPMFGYDPACTGFSLSMAPDTNATAWVTGLPGGTVWAYPVVAEGRVFIGAGGYLNAFDKNTGSLFWRFRAPSQPGYPCEVGAAEGRVFFGTKEPGPTGCIYALNASTGNQMWTFATDGYLQSNPVIVKDRLYFGGYLGTSQGKIYCINATNGASLWNQTTQDRVESIAVAYNRVYADCGHWETETKAAIYCLNPYNGNTIWTFGTDQTLSTVAGGLSVANGKVYCDVSDINTNLVLYALNATNGNQVWNVTRYSNGNTGGTAVAHGKVFLGAGSGAGGVYALNETNGDQIWAFGGQAIGGGPVVADGKVFFAVGAPQANVFYAVNETTGTVVWNYTLGGGVHSITSAIANGRVIAADHYDPKLYAFGPQYTGARSDIAITTTAGGTTNPSPGNYSYTNGTIAGVTAIPDDDYILHHWELDGSNAGSQNPITVTMDTNHTLHVVFNYNATIEAHCYTEGADVSVSIVMDGSPTGYTTPYTFTNLTDTHNFTVPETDWNGHLFKQWNTGETNTSIAVSTYGAYIAYYQARYNLTITTTTEGTTDPSPGNYSYWDGTSVNVKAIPSLGYLLDHWELDDSNVGAPDPISVTMNSNHTLNATFSWVGICNLTIPTTDGGTTNPSPGTYSYTNGTVANITATAAKGYFFSYWLLDGSNVGNINPILVAMRSNHTLYASFYRVSYGGCPFLYVYDGEEYVNEGMLNIDSPAGSDVSVNHTLNTQPKRVGDTYLFQLVESQLTVSHVDQVALYAVLEDGTTVKLSLTSAWHKDQGNVLPQLLDDDGKRTDLLGARWTNNGESQSLQLAFSALAANIRIKAFIFYIDGNAWCSQTD